MTPLLVAVAILLGSGTISLAASRWPRLATGVAAAGVVAGSLLGLPPALAVLRGGAGAEVSFAWAVPAGTMRLGLDPLTAFFLVPLFAVGALCAVYGASYMLVFAPRRSLGPPALFFNVTLAAMMLVLLARDGVVLLVAWEVMTVASYLLVSFEHQQPEVRRAGWAYLVAGHLGVACLFALFLTLGQRAGSLGFGAIAAHAPAGGAGAALVFVLAAVGFGVKAGVVPLHVWLPEAHAAAPSHVSALMSAVLIKLGLYGFLRITTFLRPPSWWGPSLIVLGLASAFLGIALAIYQRDIKRVLAYSSVENVGIILLAVGLGFWGLANGHPRIGALGLYGALLHVWNHAVIKGLLFLGAGSVLHGGGTRDLERLGGLLRRMPWTGAAVILGAVAIAGLPPLSAFASEWLIYMGLLGGGVRAASAGHGLLLLFASTGLAMLGVMAAMCFLRVVGVALLGQPRSAHAAQAHESGRWMLAPLAILGAATILMSLLAPRLVTLLALPVRQLAGAPLDAGIASVELRPITAMALALWAALLLVALVLAALVRRRRAVQPAAPAVTRDETWGCGYLAPTARMQYTGRAFAELLTGLLPPPLRGVVLAREPASLFPQPGSLSVDCTDPLMRSVYQPFFDRWARRFSRLRWMQRGVLHAYLFYILVALVAGLAWASARRWWWGSG
jgi:formate hydrogenlyase subunit 3/multisubunit Na+/H+ antiporter MnhD subunit